MVSLNPMHKLTDNLIVLSRTAAKTPYATLATDVDSVKEGADFPDVGESAKRNQKALVKACLQRDDSRCIITRLLSTSSEEHKKSPDLPHGRTVAAHILPFCLGSFTEATKEAKAKTWRLLYQYFPEIQNLVSVSTINNLENVITLSETLHYYLGELKLSLRALVSSSLSILKNYPLTVSGNSRRLQDHPPRRRKVCPEPKRRAEICHGQESEVKGSLGLASAAPCGYPARPPLFMLHLSR